MDILTQSIYIVKNNGAFLLMAEKTGDPCLPIFAFSDEGIIIRGKMHYNNLQMFSGGFKGI